MTTVQRIRDQIARYPSPRVGYITVPSPTLLQARVTRNRQTWRETFAIRDYGGSVAATFRAARSYLNALAPHLPVSHRLRTTCAPYKSSDLPPGVSIAPRFDHRRNIEYTAIQVHWNDGQRDRNKTFHIGQANIVDPADYQAVIDIAIEFRQAYEQARMAGKPFDPRPWQYWRHRLPDDVRQRLTTPAEPGTSRQALAF